MNMKHRKIRRIIVPKLQHFFGIFAFFHKKNKDPGEIKFSGTSNIFKSSYFLPLGKKTTNKKAITAAYAANISQTVFQLPMK